MFKKKSCNQCGKKINNKNKFCSYCGSSLKNNQNEDWGMLGKEDTQPEFEQFPTSILGQIGGNVIGKMFEGAMKMLEKEMQKEIKNKKQNPRTNLQLFVNGKRVNINPQQTKKKQIQKKDFNSVNFSKENLKTFSTLPTQEPITNVKRLSDSIIYEIQTPGVKSIQDVSIIQLEQSIEIKAIAKNQSYFKSIPISLPIINYRLLEENLILELAA